MPWWGWILIVGGALFVLVIWCSLVAASRADDWADRLVKMGDDDVVDD